ASARALCRPPRLAIAEAGSAQGLEAVIATLEKNLPAIFVVIQARGPAFLDLLKALPKGAEAISAKLDLKGTACATAAITSAGEAGAEFEASFTQSNALLSAIGGL